VDQILQALRGILIDHLAASQPLSQNMPAGSNIIRVPNTSKFRDGDEVFIMSIAGNVAYPTQIAKVNDWNELLVDPPTLKAWSASAPESAFVQKAINHTFLKRVLIGDLKIIPDFPAITLEPATESNEWITLQGTTHEHRLTIRAYVLYDQFEKTNIGLAKLAKQIREVLLDHIHPQIDGFTYPLAADLPKGGTVVTIPDTSRFVPSRVVFIRDAKPRPNSQEDMVRSVLSATQLELATPAQYDYLVGRQAELLLVNRYFYDTRASNITYGFMPGSGGSLLKAAEITWFGKEEIIRQGNIAT